MTTKLTQPAFCSRCKNLFRVTDHPGTGLCDMCWQLRDHRGEAHRPPPLVLTKGEATVAFLAIPLSEVAELVAVGSVLANLAEVQGSRSLARRFMDILSRNGLDVQADPIALGNIIASLNDGRHGAVEEVDA